MKASLETEPWNLDLALCFTQEEVEVKMKEMVSKFSTLWISPRVLIISQFF